jgi:hypothetical protein
MRRIYSRLARSVLRNPTRTITEEKLAKGVLELLGEKR